MTFADIKLLFLKGLPVSLILAALVMFISGCASPAPKLNKRVVAPPPLPSVQRSSILPVGDNSPTASSNIIKVIGTNATSVSLAANQHIWNSLDTIDPVTENFQIQHFERFGNMSQIGIYTTFICPSTTPIHNYTVYKSYDGLNWTLVSTQGRADTLPAYFTVYDTTDSQMALYRVGRD